MSHVIEFKGAMRPPKKTEPAEPLERGMTGSLPGMLQDDSRELSRWLSMRAESTRLAREAAEDIKTQRVRERHDAVFDRPPKPSRIQLRRRWRDAVSLLFLFAALALAGVFNHLKD